MTWLFELWCVGRYCGLAENRAAYALILGGASSTCANKFSFI